MTYTIPPLEPELSDVEIAVHEMCPRMRPEEWRTRARELWEITHDFGRTPQSLLVWIHNPNAGDPLPERWRAVCVVEVAQEARIREGQVVRQE